MRFEDASAAGAAGCDGETILTLSPTGRRERGDHPGAAGRGPHGGGVPEPRGRVAASAEGRFVEHTVDKKKPTTCL